MYIIELAEADISLVKILNGTPHCLKHGAMNKTNKLEDGGGFWRCLSAVSITQIINGNSIGKKENDTPCRAGCCEKRLNGFYTMDGKLELWSISYYPLTECGKTGEIYEEPRALIERPILNGTDFREIPLRYLTKNG